MDAVVVDMGIVPTRSGMMMTGAFGLHGLGDATDTIDTTIPVDTTTFPLDPGIYGPGGSGSFLPLCTPITPSYTPAATPSPTTNLLDSLAASWSAAAQQILKSNAGALPTYQTINPLTGASTTVYGSAANIPTSLTTAVSSLTTGSGGLLLLGGAALLIVMMISKGR